jgi:hypothetical protein
MARDPARHPGRRRGLTKLRQELLGALGVGGGGIWEIFDEPHDELQGGVGQGSHLSCRWFQSIPSHMRVGRIGSASDGSGATRTGILLIAAGVLLAGCTQPVQQAGGAGEAGVSAAVDSCSVDPALTTATANVTVRSTRSHLLVSMSATLSDAAGEVIARSSGVVSNVQPGQAYHTKILFNLDGTPPGTVSCRVAVDSTA